MSIKLSLGAQTLESAAHFCYRVGMDSTPQLPGAPKSLIAEFWDFIVHEKVWWMTPILAVLLAMVAFILFAEASPVLPFIYAL